MFQHTAARRRLAVVECKYSEDLSGFNTQPPEGGWGVFVKPDLLVLDVSTHSRPKAAGSPVLSRRGFFIGVSTHSRPKAAGRLYSRR